MKTRILDILAVCATVALICAIAIPQLAPRSVTAETGDTDFTNVVATGEVVSPVVYDLYSSSTGYGHRTRTFEATLSSGTASINYGSGVEPVVCTGRYNQATMRSFAINFGRVSSVGRTMTIRLGGGGTTNDVIAGTCLTKEIR